MATLVVIHAFGGYAEGQQITDPATVAAIEASPNSVYVVPAANSSGVSSGGGPSSPSPSVSSQIISLTAVSTYAVTFSSTAPPLIRLFDTSGALVETDVAIVGSQIVLSFPVPFTGTLFVG